jgi:hypothetical protein
MPLKGVCLPFTVPGLANTQGDGRVSATMGARNSYQDRLRKKMNSSIKTACSALMAGRFLRARPCPGAVIFVASFA